MEERILGRDNKEGDVIATAMRAPRRAWACSKEKGACTELAPFFPLYYVCLRIQRIDEIYQHEHEGEEHYVHADAKTGKVVEVERTWTVDEHVGATAYGRCEADGDAKHDTAAEPTSLTNSLTIEAKIHMTAITI